MYRAVITFFLWAFCYLRELHPFSTLEPLSVSGSSKGIIAVQAVSSSLVYRAKIARLVTQGTFAFAICGLRVRRPALRLLRHIGRCRDLMREGQRSSGNIVPLLHISFLHYRQCDVFQDLVPFAFIIISQPYIIIISNFFWFFKCKIF